MGEAARRIGRVGAWLAIGSGAVVMLLGAAAVSWLAGQVQAVATWPVVRGAPEPEPSARERKLERAARREHRKALRRGSTSQLVTSMREEVARSRKHLVDWRGGHQDHVEMLIAKGWTPRHACERANRHIAAARAQVRDAELRYAIACSVAGAVPGGRS